MSQEVVIQIRLTLPDGATYRVITAPEPEASVLDQPLPPEPNRPANGASRPAAPVQPGVVWAVGQVHAANHKPLKSNRRGLYCPTPVGQAPDGSSIFCDFHP